jgi:cyclic pyranopterin phosphate synthase
MSDSQHDSRLTHVDVHGEARMVDVTGKEVTEREARARGVVHMKPETVQLVRDNLAHKGDVLGVARIAGIMAAKRTPELIPLCHGLPLTTIQVDFRVDEAQSQIEVLAMARTAARTGVEMEALTAVTVAALTIYDMCKAADRGMVIGDIQLTFKSGGKSGTYSAD